MACTPLALLIVKNLFDIDVHINPFQNRTFGEFPQWQLKRFLYYALPFAVSIHKVFVSHLFFLFLLLENYQECISLPLCIFFSVHSVYEWVLSAFAQQLVTKA